MEDIIQKAPITQDYLYDYLKYHNVNLNRLNELMGVSNSTLMSCFHHDLDRHGKTMSFSIKNIEKLNVALNELSSQMRNSLISFGSDHVYTNNRGTTYDPIAATKIKALSRYFKLTSFCERILGWSQSKKETILNSPSSRSYGNVCEDDVVKINTEILAVSGMLAGVELIAIDKSNKNGTKC